MRRLEHKSARGIICLLVACAICRATFAADPFPAPQQAILRKTLTENDPSELVPKKLESGLTEILQAVFRHWEPEPAEAEFAWLCRGVASGLREEVERYPGEDPAALQEWRKEQIEPRLKFAREFDQKFVRSCLELYSADSVDKGILEVRQQMAGALADIPIVAINLDLCIIVGQLFGDVERWRRGRRGNSVKPETIVERTDERLIAVCLPLNGQPTPDLNRANAAPDRSKLSKESLALIKDSRMLVSRFLQKTESIDNRKALSDAEKDAAHKQLRIKFMDDFLRAYVEHVFPMILQGRVKDLQHTLNSPFTLLRYKDQITQMDKINRKQVQQFLDKSLAERTHHGVLVICNYDLDPVPDIVDDVFYRLFFNAEPRQRRFDVASRLVKSQDQVILNFVGGKDGLSALPVSTEQALSALLKNDEAFAEAWNKLRRRVPGYQQTGMFKGKAVSFKRYYEMCFSYLFYSFPTHDLPHLERIVSEIAATFQQKLSSLQMCGGQLEVSEAKLSPLDKKLLAAFLVSTRVIGLDDLTNQNMTSRYGFRDLVRGMYGRPPIQRRRKVQTSSNQGKPKALVIEIDPKPQKPNAVSEPRSKTAEPGRSVIRPRTQNEGTIREAILALKEEVQARLKQMRATQNGRLQILDSYLLRRLQLWEEAVQSRIDSNKGYENKIKVSQDSLIRSSSGLRKALRELQQVMLPSKRPDAGWLTKLEGPARHLGAIYVIERKDSPLFQNLRKQYTLQQACDLHRAYLKQQSRNEELKAAYTALRRSILLDGQ